MHARAPKQGEPEFERLKRELEEVKNAPRGLEGTFRTAAEMERHRAQVRGPPRAYSAALGMGLQRSCPCSRLCMAGPVLLPLWA
jgi:hypothetical protein